MKNLLSTPTLLVIALIASACSSMPTTTSLLDQARGDYMAASRDPNVINYAPLQLKQSGEALAQADAAAGHNDSAEAIDKLAYVAKQKIALAQEVAKQKTAEADIAASGKERDRIRLAQRTNEADRANQDAEQSRREAEQSRLAAQAAAQQTSDAQAKTREAEARAAQLEGQMAELAAKKTERGMVITLGDVLFGTDMARLTPDGMRTAQTLANVLQQNPQRTVLVEGFTDSTGSAEHNQALSERRAGAVRTALQDLGVAQARVAVRGYGPAYPVAVNTTAANRQLNRRVEIVLSEANAAIAPR
jgi:outer membrane protein OmpA-like peptidoglycan-associated protein